MYDRSVSDAVRPAGGAVSVGLRREVRREVCDATTRRGGVVVSDDVGSSVTGEPPARRGEAAEI
jgi:hypothetical protein